MLSLPLLTLALCTGATLDAGTVTLRLGTDGCPAELIGARSRAELGGADVRLTWTGGGAAPTDDGPLDLVGVTEEERSLTVVRSAGPWEVTIAYWAPSDWCIARQAVLRNVSGERQEVTGAAYPVSGSDATTYRIAPAFCLSAVDGHVAAALREATDPASVQVTDRGAEHRVSVRARVDAGQSIVLDPQYLWLAEGDAELAPPRIQEWYRLVGLTPPTDRPGWADDAMIFSAHPGGHIDSWFQDTGGFPNLQSQLAYIDWLGVNTLWLLPIYTYCAGARLGDGCPYGPMDFYQIEPALGGEEAARRFVDAAHAMGMHVLIDIVPHGGSDPHVADHPEWRLRDVDGTPKAVFGWTCDYAAEGWQEVMADVARTWVRRLDVDGYRVDVSEGMGENLGPDVLRPSYSALGGPVAMLGRMREAARSEKADALMYPEGFDRLPWLPHTDISYGFRLFFWLKSQQGRVGSDSGRWAELLVQYLREEEAQVPEGTLIARQLTNHDMDRDYGHVTYSFGVGVSQALMAALVASRGVPFVYEGQERGAELLYSRLLATRTALSEMRHGGVVYGAADAPDGVFTVWRWTDEGATLALVNFTGHPVTGTVVVDPNTLPSPPGLKRVGDVWSGEVLSTGWEGDAPLTLSLELEAFECRFLAVRPAGEAMPLVPPVKRAPTGTMEMGPPQVEPFLLALDPAAPLPVPAGAVQITRAAGTPEAYTVRIDSTDVGDLAGKSFGVRVRIPGATRWLVNTDAGLLEGVHTPRYRNWTPAPGYGTSPGLHGGIHAPNRLWESKMHPLHRQEGFVAVETQGGLWRIGLRGVSPAVALYLDDGSARGDDGVLKLHIAVADAFAPRVWRGPFTIVGAEAPGLEGGTTALSLSLEPLASLDRETLTRGVTYHTPTQRPAQVAGEVDASGQGGMLYLPRPGAMRYELEVPSPGRWHLWLELRRSESSLEGTDLEDGYTLALDGDPVAFRWQRRPRHAVGNSYVDWVSVGPLDLTEGPHVLVVTTLKTWCAVAERVVLTRDPTWNP